MPQSPRSGASAASKPAGVLTPGELLRRLDPLRLGAEAGRHGALRTVLADTWDLLDTPARDALAVATVFRAPFTVAAGAVLPVPAGALVDDVVGALRERSLLRAVSAEAEVRLALPEPVRRFAEARLDGDARETAERRHAMTFRLDGAGDPMYR